ncbi:VOC family protein [Micrococcales bacterium 31B]|nr:VOC family protein [Micrococcales bacterium 31B]
MSITTCLWFDGQAADAAEFYVSLFDDSRIHATATYPENFPEIGGTVMTVEFEIMGQQFLGLNAGPGHPHSDAVSFQIPCDDQATIDRYWDALVADGGAESMCGWCVDKFGISWQITYARMGQLMKDPATAPAVSQAMMQQRKMIVADLEAAAAGA